MSDAARELHPAALSETLLLRACTIRRTRRGGPGGQHRNKVETAVVITHAPTGLQGEGSERRSQDLNRQAAVQRLRVKLALHVRGAVSLNDLPSELWQARASGGKLRVSTEHADFPALLAEALDYFFATDRDISTASRHLGVSASQLTKFLQQAPQAIALVNAARQERGLRPLQ